MESPARKCFVSQVCSAYSDDLERFPNEECPGRPLVRPLLGGSCSPHAVLQRVWLQGQVVEAGNGNGVLNDGTGAIAFIFSSDVPVAANTAIQLVGLVTATPAGPAIFAELCPRIEENEKNAWPSEVLAFQANFVFV